MGGKCEDCNTSPLLACKADAGDTAVQVTNEAMTLCGGIAYRDNSKLARMLRDARASHVMAPTTDILKRLPYLPKYVSPGPHNPMGARALYLFQGNKDTLFRIHGTNQPEYIGQAISSGCIRMLNEDVIDLYNRVPMGAKVIVI